MDQGGDRMDVTEEATGTLRAEARHPPCVMAAGFCTEHSADSRSIGYGDETSPTLRAGTVPAAVALEHHPNDSRIGIADGNVVQTLAGRMGTGGGNVPLVMAPDGPFLPYTLKIRSGRGGGGKGALIQEDLSATLATANDQALFEPKAFGISSDQSHAMLSANPRAGIYEAGTSRTLDTSGGTPACSQGGIAVVERAEEAYDVRFTSEGSRVSRGNVYPTDTARTLSADCQDPAGNQGGIAVAGKAYALQGSMIGRSEGNGPQGDGVNEGVSFTLNTADRHAVAFADTHPALCAKDGPGGIHSQMQKEPEGSFVAEPAFSSTCGAYMASSEEVAQTLMARDYKDPQFVNAPHYTVRRLTPTECARLQGFPDWWCRGLGTPDPTEEDIAFWAGAFEEYRRTVTHAAKPKTRNQIVKWLRDPHSDSEEYRLWGNGIALPCAWFVLAGIVYYDQNGG